DASPPWWSETSTVLCQALENKFFLASSLAGPAHLPLLSVFAVSVKLPFVPVKSNLTRLLSYIEELRSLPQEAALQQFKQYMCHTANGDFNSSCVEVRTFTAKTKVTPLFEETSRHVDNAALRRSISTAIFVSQDSFRSLPPVESLMLGTEMDLQLMEGTVVALENSLKMWLHDHGGDREHLRLLLPPLSHNRVLHHTLPTDLGVKTESMQDFQPPNKSLANQNPSSQCLRVVKYSQTRDWFLLVRSGSGSGSGVFSYYILQSSGSLSLLLKPVLTQELMLPCCLPVSLEDPPIPALASVKMPRPLLTLSHSRPCAPALFQDSYEEEDPLMIQ
uniref:Meiosis 1 associated protein n=1 Tax=Cyprinus carpio TaxID=7962 RepID=A0A8C2HY48_CYPCA